MAASCCLDVSSFAFFSAFRGGLSKSSLLTDSGFTAVLVFFISSFVWVSFVLVMGILTIITLIGDYNIIISCFLARFMDFGCLCSCLSWVFLLRWA